MRHSVDTSFEDAMAKTRSKRKARDDDQSPEPDTKKTKLQTDLTADLTADPTVDPLVMDPLVADPLTEDPETTAEDPSAADPYAMIDPALLAETMANNAENTNDPAETQSETADAIVLDDRPIFAPPQLPFYQTTQAINTDSMASVPQQPLPVHRAVPWNTNPLQFLDATQGDWDQKASLEEGHLMSTLHHHFMIVSGQPSHIARKMVAPELAQLLQDTRVYVVSKIREFTPVDAQVDNPTAPFCKRLVSLLSAALVKQYATPKTPEAVYHLFYCAEIEARKWTLEILAAWDRQYRERIKANKPMKTASQRHIQQASR